MAGTLRPFARALLSSLPSYLIFFVTARCNSRCRTCFYWRNIEDATRDELTLDEIQQIASKAGFVGYLTISGGEPTLREDLPAIVKAFYDSCDLEVVSIPTNGSLPETTVGMARQILHQCPGAGFRLALSVDGIGDDHDHIRGVAGSFDKVLESYRLLAPLRDDHPNFTLDVATVLSSFNQDDIESVFDWVKEHLEVDNHVLVLTRGQPREAAASEVPAERYEEAARHVERIAFEQWSRRRDLRRSGLKAVKLAMRDVIVKTLREDRMVVPCVAGRRMAVLTESGDVYPCELLDDKMGNLREVDYDMARIVGSEEARQVRSMIKRTRCHCTFECAIQNSLVYSPRAWARIAAKLVR
jgi:radical SAM protein with 4Fe4S-binding SPASM domain